MSHCFLVEKLIEICKGYHNRVYRLNEEKWDLEFSTCVKEYEVEMAMDLDLYAYLFSIYGTD